MICPFCQKEAEWVQNKEVYGKNFGKSFMIWLCRPCRTYVGCHNNTKKPLGTMADSNLRLYRVKAHKLFDPLWESGKKSRNSAYRVLERHFKRKIHIGESDIETCKEIIRFLNEDYYRYQRTKTPTI